MRSPEPHPVLAAVLEARAELGQALTCVHQGDPEGALRREARSRALLEGLTLEGTTPEVREQLRGAARDVELVRAIVRQALQEVAVELARVRAEVRIRARLPDGRRRRGRARRVRLSQIEGRDPRRSFDFVERPRLESSFDVCCRSDRLLLEGCSLRSPLEPASHAASPSLAAARTPLGSAACAALRAA